MKLVSTFRVATVAALSVMASGAGAAVVVNPASVTPVTLTSTSYAQDFDGLGAGGTVTLAGWQVVEDGNNANATYAVGTGSANAGNSYSFGAAGAADRALGSLTSGNLATIRYGALFTNGLSSAISSLGVSYDGEQWRAGTADLDMFVFEYQIGTTDLTAASGWTTVSALNFASLVNDASTQGALDGNAAANRRSLTSAINGLSIGAGQSFALRWTDSSASGSNHGLAIDNFALTATAAAVPEPAIWAMMLIGFAAICGAARYRRRGERVVIG